MTFLMFQESKIEYLWIGFDVMRTGASPFSFRLDLERHAKSFVRWGECWVCLLSPSLWGIVGVLIDPSWASNQGSILMLDLIQTITFLLLRALILGQTKRKLRELQFLFALVHYYRYMWQAYSGKQKCHLTLPKQEDNSAFLHSPTLVP